MGISRVNPAGTNGSTVTIHPSYTRIVNGTADCTGKELASATPKSISNGLPNGNEKHQLNDQQSTRRAVAIGGCSGGEFAKKEMVGAQHS